MARCSLDLIEKTLGRPNDFSKVAARRKEIKTKNQDTEGDRRGGFRSGRRESGAAFVSFQFVFFCFWPRRQTSRRLRAGVREDRASSAGSAPCVRSRGGGRHSTLGPSASPSVRDFFFSPIAKRQNRLLHFQDLGHFVLRRSTHSTPALFFFCPIKSSTRTFDRKVLCSEFGQRIFESGAPPDPSKHTATGGGKR